MFAVEVKSGNAGEPPSASNRLQHALKWALQSKFFSEDWVNSVYQIYYAYGNGEIEEDNLVWGELADSIPTT